MDKFFSYIISNNITQIDVPKYGSTNNIACEFTVPRYLAANNKKVVVCLPDNFSIKLSYEYMKNFYPELRVGYGDVKNVCHNLSTQINYITQKYLKYKILQYYQYNTKFENFADVIIIFNPDMNNDDNIFSISAFKYANNNNISLPKLCILNSEYSFKLTDNRVFFKNQKIKMECFDVLEKDIYSSNKLICNLIKSNYNKYTYDANFLIYVPNLKTAVTINNILKTLLKNCKVLIVSKETPNIFSEISNIKTKKIIIAVDLGEFYFENISFVINLPKSFDNTNNSKLLNKEEYIKNLSSLIIDYVKCDICLSKIHINNVTNKFEKINVKNTVDLLNTLQLLMKSGDKLLISASGIFFERIQLSPIKTSFIWEWISNGFPIYEGLIIISLIDEFLPLIDQNFHSKWIGKSPLHTYLNMFKSFNFDNKNTINNIIKNYDQNDVLICKKWATRNKIQEDKFLILISNISKIFNNIFNELRNVNTIISDFDVESIINKASPILIKIYFLDILIVKNNSIIQPHDNITYLLNKHYFTNVLKDEKIIPLLLRSKTSISKSKIVYVDNFIII